MGTWRKWEISAFKLQQNHYKLDYQARKSPAPRTVTISMACVQ